MKDVRIYCDAETAIMGKDWDGDEPPSLLVLRPPDEIYVDCWGIELSAGMLRTGTYMTTANVKELAEQLATAVGGCIYFPSEDADSEV